MSQLSSRTVPLAIRVRNNRYDGLVTGYLHGAVQFQKADPGGFIAASFVMDQQQGFRTDMIQPYSRVYIYDKRNGRTVFEGDVSHPGREFGDGGALMQIQVDGGVARLEDWSGPRIYCDSDMTAWTKHYTSVVSTRVEVGLDKGGSGLDAMLLAFPLDTHVQLGDMVEVIYQRILQSGQQLGRIAYSWDGGQNNASWQIRTFVEGGTQVRLNNLSLAGGGDSAAYVGASWTAPKTTFFMQLRWNSGPSSTGTTGLDLCWASIMELKVIAYLYLKDGTRRAGIDHDAFVTADQVWEDMLGDPDMLKAFNGDTAQLTTGVGVEFTQLAFPDGTTPRAIADEMMKMETFCTYIVGPSSPADDLYTIEWLDRSSFVRYEFAVWADAYSNGTQSVEQYNRAVTRWVAPNGVTKFEVTTQVIPEMDAVDRTRTYFQDLSDISGGTVATVSQANATILLDHRYPKNGGQISVSRTVVDLFTGRRVEPWEIEPSYQCRLLGVDPQVDALNTAVDPNGTNIFRIVATDYDAASGTATLDLDGVPLSLMATLDDQNTFTPRRQG